MPSDGPHRLRAERAGSPSVQRTHTVAHVTHRQASRGNGMPASSTRLRAAVATTAPADAGVRIGLIAHGRTAETEAPATARFDYLRLYAD